MSEPIWSTGGVGGERAVTEDLDWAVTVLRAAAGDVASAGAELARRRAALELDPGVGHAALASELGYAAHTAAARLEGELDDTARRLAEVSGAYLAAERAARHGVAPGLRVREALSDAALSQVWAARAAVVLALIETPLEPVAARRILPHGQPPTTSVLGRDVVERLLGTPAYRALVIALEAMSTLPWIQLMTMWTGRLTTIPVREPPAASVEDVMLRLHDTERADGGAVRIERWTDDSGVTRRIVYIPGTQDWLNLTTNPSDLSADLELLAGGTPDASRVVVAALLADGAGPEDPVMLAGHSLGGIVAASLAANPEFRERFAVQAVVTAGSPTGRFSLPATVNALHLEGTRDIVPGLDGRPNPDTPTRVTVHHDARESELVELDGAATNIGSAHNLDTYAQTARLVDEGLSPSTDAWLDAEKDFLEPGKDVIVTEYRP